MNAIRRMLGMMGGAVLAAVDEAQGRGVELAFEPVAEREPPPSPVALMDALKTKYKQTRKRVTHWALKVGAWKVGQIMTLHYSRRQYQVFPDGSWRRLFNGVPRLAS